MDDEPRIPRDLAGWYAELAQVWLHFAQTCRLKFENRLHAADIHTAEQYLDLARRASLRCGRYARLAEQHRTHFLIKQGQFEDLTTDELGQAIKSVHGLAEDRTGLLEG